MEKLCYKLIKIILTCDKKLFVYIMFDITMHHACFPHQGDLLLRDDISVRHLAFNNIKCKVYTHLIFDGLTKVYLKMK